MVHSDTGVSIISKKIFGQFLITSQPEIFINGQFVQNLRWNKEVFVALKPGLKHQIEISFPYMLGPSAQANMAVVLQQGEVMCFRYKTPLFITSPGKISRIG